MKLSIIIAVYQREEELKELLQSLTLQKCKNFEVLIIDDGSPKPLESLANSFSSELDIFYYYKENSGPGKSRNYGMKKANGDYFIFLDSDTITPTDYICNILKSLEENYTDFFGGSDTAKQTFSPLQKAINYSMTSFLTTGGIRSGGNKVSKFQPRSFNMGISKKAFEISGGFSDLRIGEDPDLSMRLWEKGLESRWLPNVAVFHKRRTSLRKFGKQVKNFGIARPILNQRHPKYNQLTFWFPSVFIVGFTFSLLLSFFGYWEFIALFGLYFAAIFLSSSYQNKSLWVGFLSCVATFIQFENYGYGFLLSQWKLNVKKQSPKKAFPNHFYKA